MTTQKVQVFFDFAVVSGLASRAPTIHQQEDAVQAKRNRM